LKNILEIQDLCFGYTKEKLLYNHFSLSLKKGEIKAIVGESGVGKSTLFGLILKDLKPKSGTIKSVEATQVFQDPYSSFHPSYTILNQISDVAKIQELETYLLKLNIEYQLLTKLPHQLSGGQLQRCSILRALLMKRELLLLDEPTSALDNVVQLEVMKMIVSLKDEIGILLITHDMALARWCADEIVTISSDI
jgi:peptide/nickel transport system ATP-binding protein